MEEELYTRIEEYLDNTLDEPARATFEAEARADPALARALAEVREARASLAAYWKQEAADRALAATLRQAGREHFAGSTPEKNAESSAPMTLQRYWPALAAAACLAGLLFWFFGRQTQGGNDDKLFAQYRHYPEAAFTTRAAGDSAQIDLGAAERAFNGGRYAEALPLLQAYLETHSDDLEKRFFVGLCHLELGNYNEAITNFQVLRSSANAYQGEAVWYLALTYLKQGNKEQCANILRQLPPGSGHDAAALLKEIQ